MTIQNGLENVAGSGMAVASDGAVYVAGYNTKKPFGEFLIYPPQKTKPKLTVSQENVVMTAINVFP
jgi:hypothetical protein